ncbi:hypothetical protein CEXT_651891, partial [Caerostris extrusa]
LALYCWSETRPQASPLLRFRQSAFLGRYCLCIQLLPWKLELIAGDLGEVLCRTQEGLIRLTFYLPGDITLSLSRHGSIDRFGESEETFSEYKWTVARVITGLSPDENLCRTTSGRCQGTFTSLEIKMLMDNIASREVELKFKMIWFRGSCSMHEACL